VTIETGGPDAAPQALRARWHEESLGSVWLRPADWYHPAVDALAVAILGGGDAVERAHALGRARGDDGVGVGEALDDLACLFRVTSSSEPPLHLVRALVQGWADAQAGLVATGAAVDAATGLPTRGYLVVRLAEQYAGPAPRGDLLVVDVAVADQPRWASSVRAAAVGGALVDTFGSGHPMATIGGGVFAVLVRPADDAVEPRVAELRVRVAHAARRLAVDELMRQPPRARVVPLPELYDDAVALLDRAAHAD
jgi:hypothetical protein